MSEFQDHPISLENVVFVRSVVEAIPEHDPEQSHSLPPPENQLHVQKIDATDARISFTASMRTTINKERSKDAPYFIDMECVAILHADPKLGEQEGHRGATITAHSVLYGAIREAVAWLTGRQPYGPVVLGLSVLKPRKPDAPEPSLTGEAPATSESN